MHETMVSLAVQDLLELYDKGVIGKEDIRTLLGLNEDDSEHGKVLTDSEILEMMGLDEQKVRVDGEFQDPTDKSEFAVLPDKNIRELWGLDKNGIEHRQAHPTLLEQQEGHDNFFYTFAADANIVFAAVNQKLYRLQPMEVR